MNGKQLAKLLFDEIFDSTRLEEATEMVNTYVIEELQSNITGIMRENCYGCIVDHPSQTQHPLCLFSTTDEWVDLFMNTALRKLDAYKIMERMYEDLQRMNLTRSEKADIYQMWKHIKDSVDEHKITPKETFVSEWSERVKGAWNHGDD